MPKLIDRSLDLLTRMYDAQSHLFSFSTRLTDSKYVNDFENAGKYRYTVNVIAALQRLDQFGIQAPWDLTDVIGYYLRAHLTVDTNLANRGLLLHVLTQRSHPAAGELYEWLRARIEPVTNAFPWSVQELAWASLGITSYAHLTGDPRATDLARRLVAYMLRDLMNPRTLLPRHDKSSRGVFISFGGIVYFLMALHHYASTFADHERLELFKQAVARVIALQGPQGEWPWFMDSSNGAVMDWYQVYSVHQDAMAMLFLLPALDLGLESARLATEKSYRWLFGHNELATPLIQEQPFFICRSIRRRRTAERPVRLAAAFMRKSLGMSASLAGPDKVFINRECRSYHIGWILYAWAGREGFNEFTDLTIGSR